MVICQTACAKKASYLVCLREQMLTKSTQIFRTYSLCSYFFWQMSTCKIMLKLTKGVNFINIIRALFSYKHCFGSFFPASCTYKNLSK
jgi:hypothetical protein